MCTHWAGYQRPTVVPRSIRAPLPSPISRGNKQPGPAHPAANATWPVPHPQVIGRLLAEQLQLQSEARIVQQGRRMGQLKARQMGNEDRRAHSQFSCHADGQPGRQSGNMFSFSKQLAAGVQPFRTREPEPFVHKRRLSRRAMVRPAVDSESWPSPPRRSWEQTTPILLKDW